MAGPGNGALPRLDAGLAAGLHHVQASKDKPKAAAPATPAPAAGAGGAPAAAPPAAAWVVNCSDHAGGALACEMSQLLVERNTGRQLAFISIKSVSQGDAKIMLFRILHGVYLPAGVSVAIDEGAATAVEFQKSDQAGIYAALPLSDKLVGELRKGKEMKIGLQLNKGEPLALTALLTGFGGAFDRIGAVK